MISQIKEEERRIVGYTYSNLKTLYLIHFNQSNSYKYQKRCITTSVNMVATE